MRALRALLEKQLSQGLLGLTLLQIRCQIVPRWVQHGAKLPAKWLPGGLWSRGPGRPKKFILAALERPWSEKWIDFGLLEGPREGPGGGLGCLVGAIPEENVLEAVLADFGRVWEPQIDG